MARTSYSFQKRQKELAKKKKQEEKKQRKLEKKGQGGPEVEGFEAPAEQEQAEEQTTSEETAERPKPGVIPPSS